MKSIESVAQRGFLMGVMSLLLEYKVKLFEKNMEDAMAIAGLFEKIFNHNGLMKDLSPVVYLEFTLTRAMHNFIYKDLSLNVFKDLLESFKFYKIYRRFKKK